MDARVNSVKAVDTCANQRSDFVRRSNCETEILTYHSALEGLWIHDFCKITQTWVCRHTKFCNKHVVATNVTKEGSPKPPLSRGVA